MIRTSNDNFSSLKRDPKVSGIMFYTFMYLGIKYQTSNSIKFF